MNADTVAGLSPEAKRKLLNELLQKQQSANLWYPLTEGQKGLWVQYQLAPQSSAYISVFCVRILSPLDTSALKKSFQTIVDRHESLRSRFALRNGVAMQEIKRSMPVPFYEKDVSELSDEQLRELLVQESRRPFNLEREPVVRIQLFRKKANEHFLLLTVFHIAFDHWSLNLILDELRLLYPAAKEGREAALPAIELGYSDYVRWQKEMLTGSEGDKLWRYWESKLAGELPSLDLPTDRPRPPNENFEGASHQYTLSAELTGKMRALAKAEGKTLYSLFLAAFQVLMHRYSGQDDILVGSPTLGLRRPEFQKVVGYFTNLVALRGDLSGNPTFRELLDRVQKTVLEAMDHQEFPFPLVVQRLQPVRDPSRSPIFQVQFNLIRVPKNDLGAEAHIGSESRRVELGGLELEAVHLPQQEGQFDLDMMMVEETETISGPIKYRSDLFDRETIERMAGHLTTLLEGIVDRPDTRVAELPLLTSSERQSILMDWNRTDAQIAIDRVHELFEAQAARTPEATAVVFGEERLSYRELNERANRLARYLRTLGVGRESLVGVCVERSPDMIVALLGTLKAGAAYVPLDPNFPKDRLAYMLQDSGAAVLVTQEGLLQDLPSHQARVVRMDSDHALFDREDSSDLSKMAGGSDLVYVIYTSGSTGKPKGVQVKHRAVANVLQFFAKELSITSGDALLAVTTLSFDIAALELFLPLSSGGRLVLADRASAVDGSRLTHLLQKEKITVMQATPVTWRLLLGSGWKEGSGLRVLCGGEAWTKELADRLLETGAALWNVYGPTETTIWSTCQRILPDENVRIGRPMANTQIYVLNPAMQPVPVGTVGDLYIGGSGLARGYFNRPELTVEKFVANPFHEGTLIYKTGDLARWTPQGELEFLGRIDHQVKIRGFRIETGEIETALAKFSAIKQAVVVAHDESSGEKQLVAYIMPAGERPSVGAIRQFLKGGLPDYMIPAAYVFLDQLPLTPNGKIDQKALPEPSVETRSTIETVFASPGDELEQQIAAIWAQTLRLQKVGREDNFFELGGHSLTLLEVQNKLKQIFSRDIPTVVMFSRPTVRTMAEYLRGDAESTSAPTAERETHGARSLRTARLEHRRKLLDS